MLGGLIQAMSSLRSEKPLGGEVGFGVKPVMCAPQFEWAIDIVRLVIPVKEIETLGLDAGGYGVFICGDNLTG